MPGRQGRIRIAVIDQTAEFLVVRKTPVADRRAVGEIDSVIRQVVAGGQSGDPTACRETSGILQPDQPGQVIGDRAVQVVGESR